MAATLPDRRVIDYVQLNNLSSVVMYKTNARNGKGKIFKVERISKKSRQKSSKQFHNSLYKMCLSRVSLCNYLSVSWIQNCKSVTCVAFFLSVTPFRITYILSNGKDGPCKIAHGNHPKIYRQTC